MESGKKTATTATSTDKAIFPKPSLVKSTPSLTISKSSQTVTVAKQSGQNGAAANNGKMDSKDKFDSVKCIEPISGKKIGNDGLKNVNKQWGGSFASATTPSNNANAQASANKNNNNNNQKKKDSASSNNSVNKANAIGNQHNSKPVLIAPKVQNELKKDNIMPSPAVLLAPRVHRIKSSGFLPPKISSTNDPDDRKKRCADRYDSSESSDR